jgi:DNA ligase (NAD+)
MGILNDLDKIKILVTELNRATEAYDEGNPYMTDAEWDAKFFELQKLENEYNYYMINSPTQIMWYVAVNELTKIKHNHAMLSLDKTKDWNSFINYFNSKDPSKSVVGMLKLDGLTCSLRYRNGYLETAETRGNGIIGEDILHNAKVIKSIPNRINYTDELVIDGEIICTYQNFEPWQNEYKNPRNFASGSIRLLNSSECEKRNLTFVAWNVVKGFDNTNSFIDKLEKLEELSFIVVPWTSSLDLGAEEFLKNEAKILGYPIDGLVGRFDDISFGESLGSTAHHLNAAYAFKFYDEEYETELLDIEWTMGRTGQITPVAVFESIEIDGTNVSRASLHNISIMNETLHGGGWKGQKIKVSKINMIIPQIIWAEKNKKFNKPYILLPTKCPMCGEPVSIHKNNDSQILYCSNPNCEGKIINRLEHFCGKKGLDIRGLSKATLEKLLDWGWVVDEESIFELGLHRDEWIKKPGFGEKSVDNILKAIQNSCFCDLDAFISALGIPLIGKNVAKEICKYIKTWEEFRELIINKFDFTNWNTFGEEKASNLLKFDYTTADIIADRYLTFNTIEEANKGELNGLIFVITGKLKNYKNRDELKLLIEKKGGKVSSSVTSKTNYLINNDLNSASAKNNTAKKLKVPIISEKEFLKIFKIQ